MRYDDLVSCAVKLTRGDPAAQWSIGSKNHGQEGTEEESQEPRGETQE